jgi:Protein of unknown function (DUF2637)/Winged helix-turn-helix DNA-binding
MGSSEKDRYKPLTTAAVLLVAGIAAVISFVHIESLAIRYGQPPLAAYLLPVSIDGTVVVASMAMLRAARLGVTAPWLARTMLLLAVGATLACNVAYGLPHGWPGALLSGWPAIAFIGSAEVAITMSSKRPQRGPGGQAADADKTVKAARTGGQRPRGQGGQRKAAMSAADTEAAVLSALASDRGLTNAQLATAVGVSSRTARRYRSRLNGATVASE